MAGPPSELMALSLALAPACWQCLALLVEAVFPSCHACRALFHYRRERGHYQLCVLFIQARLVMTGKQQGMVVLQEPELAGTEQSSHPFQCQELLERAGNNDAIYSCTFDFSSLPKGCMWWMRDGRQTPQPPL